VKEKISAVMDGELERFESAGTLKALESGDEARETWRLYHLIGDAMRDTRMLSPGFAERVGARLKDEPTVLAPAFAASRVLASPAARRWSALAASLAAAAFVGWVAFLPGDEPAQVPQVATVLPVPASHVQQAADTLVAPPDTADDYLLAHQGYSPRNSLLGVAPYVRVSGDVEAHRQ
jgi:sigma-E factor negative regulatory protein RseA